MKNEAVERKKLSISRRKLYALPRKVFQVFELILLEKKLLFLSSKVGKIFLNIQVLEALQENRRKSKDF